MKEGLRGFSLGRWDDLRRSPQSCANNSGEGDHNDFAGVEANKYIPVHCLWVTISPSTALQMVRGFGATP